MSALPALGEDELGSRFRLVPRARAFIGPTYKSSFNPASWAWGVGLRTYFFKPNQLPPSPWLRRVWARAVSLLESGATSTWPLRAGLVRVLSPSNILW